MNTPASSVRYKTKKFTPRNLENLVREALSHALERTDTYVLVLETKDFYEAIKLVTKDDERFSHCKKVHNIIKPHIGTTVQILGPLTIQILANGVMQLLGMEQARTFHYDTMNQQARFHAESTNLQKEGLAQQERHFKQQVICQIIGMGLNLLTGNLSGAICNWYYGNSNQQLPK